MKNETLRRIWGYALLFVVTFLLATLFMQAAHCQTALMPMPRQCFPDNLASGKPLAGGKIFTYAAGTSTPQATYTDATGTIANTNPVILDAAGCSSVWLTSGLAYRFVAQNSSGAQEWVTDQVSGLASVGSAFNQAITTVSFSATPTFTATGQFQLFKMTLTGNVTSSTLSMTGVTTPSIVAFELTEDATGGRTFVWPLNVVGGLPLNVNANQVTTQTFFWDGTSAWPVNYPTLQSTTTAFSATPTFTAVSQNQLFLMTLTGNVTSSTLVTSGITPPTEITFVLTQDATGGRTFAWPANVSGGSVPISTAPTSVTVQQFMWDGTAARAIAPAFGTSTPTNCSAVANSGTGTTLNTLTKIVGTQAQITATTDDIGAIGITVSGAGTAGNACIVQTGLASCVFDGATTAGDQVQISSTTAGNCHDVGTTAQNGAQIVGRVLSTNAAGGTYAIVLTPQNVPTFQLTNAGATGTTLNTLTKITGAPSTAVISATSDTANAIGITIAGAGTSGFATIQTSGIVQCVFDNATTAGDFIQISSGTAGNCHDAGISPPNGIEVVGRVLSTNGGAGTYTIFLAPQQPSTIQIANAGVTGTTVNTLTKLTSAPSTAVITGTSDVSGIIGITIAGAGTTGNALIQNSGVAQCVFDNATTAGDYFTQSTGTGGDCHDIGTNAGGLGRVLVTNGSPGTNSVLLMPSQAGIGGVTRDFSASGCSPATSTDSSCTGSISISPAMVDASYIPQLTINTISGGAFLAISANAALTSSSISYTITCTFNCGTIGTPTIYVHIFHP